MDEEIEVKKAGQSSPKEQAQRVAEQRKADEAEAARRNITLERVQDERRVKARWDTVVKEREAAGKKFSPEELEDIKQKIAKGELPTIAGAGIDGAFDGIDPEKYKKTKKLYDLAQELRALDRNDPDFTKKFEGIKSSIFLLMGSSTSDVPEAEGMKLIQDINAQIDIINKSEGKSSGAGKEGDGNLENLNMYQYRGTPLEAIAKEAMEYGKPENAGKQVPPDVLNRWILAARQAVGNSGVTQELAEEFVRDVTGAAMTHNFEITRGAVQEQAVNATREGGGQNNQAQQGRRIDAQGNEVLENTPRSIQDICKWIIKKEGDEWGPKGSSPLLDENENFIQENFVKWVRERMLHFHNLDPNNPSINLLGSIGIETEFKTVGLISMINNKKQYFRDEHKKDEDDNHVVYSDMVEDIVNEVYLFNTSRNHDASYRFGMWNDEELPKLLQQIHQKSDFTTGEQMKKIFTFAANYKEGGGSDTKVGDTIRTLYEAYYSISDYEELQRVLGKDNRFFTRKGFEDAWRISERKGPDEPVAKIYADFFDKIFDGKGPEAKPVFKPFMDFINVFNDTGKKQTEIALIREALRLAGEQVHGLESGLEYTGNKRSVRRKNLEYAELWAYSMVRWTGAAAKNDTNAIGYDAFTKSQRFQQYRIRQSSSSRGAPVGNQYDIPVVKAWNLDLLNGIFVEREVGDDGPDKKEFTPLEILRQVDALEDQARRGEITQEELVELKDKTLSRLKFKQYTQLDYANNHIGKSFQMFHHMMGANELNLDQIVTHDRFRGLVFDRGKFEEQVKEGFIKPIRYALSTYSNIDYAKEMRVQVNAGKTGEAPKYETKTIAEAMFGPVVLQGFYKKERGPDGKPVIDKEKLKDREKIYKHVVRSIIASHLQGHRRYNSGYAYMNEGQITKFYEALESMKSIEFADVGENTQLSEGDSFFSHEDIAWMRKYSGTENWRLITTDVVKDAGMGFMGGIFKGFKDIFDDIAKG